MFTEFKNELEKALIKHEEEFERAYKILNVRYTNKKKALIDYIIGGGKINTDEIRQAGLDPKNIAYYIILGEEKQ